MDIISHLSHSKVDFLFNKNARDFVVEELPLYPFSGKGEHLIVKIRKKNLSTKEMLNLLSHNLHIKRHEIGYAGLKDKSAMTIQYLSLNKKFAKNIERINIENLKILDLTYHDNKLKIGHLRGNRFFIRLKKLDKTNALKLQNICHNIAQMGMPNYFGVQRFGKNGDNFKEGEALLAGKLKIRDKQTRKFLISAFQSYLFNIWLGNRVKLSKIISEFNPKEIKAIYPMLESSVIKELKSQPHFFKILDGDVMKHYPSGKLFYSNDKWQGDKDSANKDSTKLAESHTNTESHTNAESQIENKSFGLNDKNLDNKNTESQMQENIIDSTQFLLQDFHSQDSQAQDSQSKTSQSNLNAKRFYEHTIAPTGLLYGSKALLAKDLALEFEKDSINDLLRVELGSRRFAWVFVKDLEFIYKEHIAHGELNFVLPSGSYATILLEILANRSIDFMENFDEE